MTSWQLRPGGLYIPPDAADGPYLVQKDGNRFSQWLRLVDGDNTTVVTDPDAGTVQVDSTGGGSGGAGGPHIDTDTATGGANLVITLTDTPAAADAVQVYWRGVALDPTQYSYVGTALTVLDQGWTTGDLVWAVYWSDVPTVVTDPTTTLGDILVRGASGLTRLPVGADGYVLTADSGATDGLDWEPPGGSGGLSQSYLGYNTIGASTQALNSTVVYMKKITMATDGLLTGIEVYIDNTADSVGALGASLNADVAGSPGQLLGYVMNAGTSFLPRPASGTNGLGRWESISLSQWLTAGDYWVGIMGPGGAPRMYYDTSGGADKNYTSGGVWFTDAGRYTINSTTNRYSIRASVLS